SSRRIGCATDQRFAQQPQVRDTRQPRFCPHQEGGLFGQVSERSVPACGAFVEYSSCNPCSPKIRGLWTHRTIGPKKWGQATGRKISSAAIFVCARCRVGLAPATDRTCCTKDP